MTTEIDLSKRRLTRYWVILVTMLVALVVLVILNVFMGSVKGGVTETIRTIFDQNSNNKVLQSIIFKIRIPRMIAVLFLGGALALSGFLLQTFFNNPIAGPFVLGISSGAKLTVTIALVAITYMHKSVSSFALVVIAFGGSMLTMGLVLLFSQKVRHSAMLIVTGVMLGYIFSAMTDFVITFADDNSIISMHNWSRGSFSGLSWSDVRMIMVVVTVTVLLVFFISKPISAYQLGENYARSVGLNVKVFRFVLVLFSSILSATVTAFAGPVSFVGIAVPHLVKALCKTAKPVFIIPVCFLGGAIFCLMCDLIARTAFAPAELSISSVTALFGAPVVIAIMLQKRK